MEPFSASALLPLLSKFIKDSFPDKNINLHIVIDINIDDKNKKETINVNESQTPTVL